MVYSKSKIKNKVGYCDNKDLPGLEHLPGGHYVYIRNVYKNGRCNVNVVTSLENNKREFKLDKLKHVKNGDTYALPKNDSNFTLWSGINRMQVKNVKIDRIQDIGKKEFKSRHKFFIDKFFGDKKKR